jgi:hypothetical protein
VLEAAQEQLEAAAGSAPKNGKAAKEPFSREELRAYFAKNATQIASAVDGARSRGASLIERLREISESLSQVTTLLDAPGLLDLEDLERRLTILDDKLQATLTSHASEEMMLKIRREMDAQLAAYRRKMKAEQIALVEKQYLQKRLLEEFRLPRLSLYYFS